MKMKSMMIVAALAIPAITNAQDFAQNLSINQGVFEITNDKSKIKDSADAANYNRRIEQDKKHPENEVEFFSYSSKSKSTPKSGLFGKHREMQLVVERENKVVTRVSTLDFSQPKEKGAKPSELYQTVSFDGQGKIKSETQCASSHASNIPVAAAFDQSNSCVTVNEKICEVIKAKEIDDALNDKIKQCSSLFSDLNDFQKEFAKAAKDDYEQDVKALNRVPTVSSVSGKSNFYELEAKTVGEAIRLSQGYAQAVARCKFYEGKFSHKQDKPSEVPAKKSVEQD